MNTEATNRTRLSLLSRLKNREDHVSWQDFFDAYWRLIYGVALKAGLTEEEAEEVVQDTVINVAKNIEAFRKDPKQGSFKGWLLHTTRWRILDQLRKRKRRALLLNESSPTDGKTALIDRLPDEAGMDLETVWEKEWESHLLETALIKVRRLVDPTRYQIFDLHVRRGWPLQKVAETLDLSLGQVYYAKSRVMVLLRRELEKLKQAPV